MQTDVIIDQPVTSLQAPLPSWISPVAGVEMAVSRYNDMLDFVKRVLHKGTDYSKIPGTDKDVLMKPGAEKLATFFGLRPEMVLIDKTENWETGLFYYRYQCRLMRDGLVIAASEGSASSYESKYRYRWVKEDDIPAGYDKSTMKSKGGSISEPDFAIEQAQTSGPYGKPVEYWAKFKAEIEAGTARKVQRKKKAGGTMDAWEIDGTLYAITNPDMADIVNTVQKMSQKRAYVGTVIMATNASEYFTQDLEGIEYEVSHIETLAEGRERFMLEIADWYPAKETVIAAFKKHALPSYSLELHDDLRKRLIQESVIEEYLAKAA